MLLELELGVEVKVSNQNSAECKNYKSLCYTQADGQLSVGPESESGKGKHNLHEPCLPPVEILSAILEEVHLLSHVSGKATSLTNCLELFASGDC